MGTTVETDLKPNDVCVILRPTVEDSKWTGHFEIMVAGFGPVTLSTEDMDALIGVATVISAVVPFMEEDIGNARMLYEFAKKYFGEESLEYDYNPDHDSFSEKEEPEAFSIDTKTVGGIH
jgi:hypothetical protein